MSKCRFLLLFSDAMLRRSSEDYTSFSIFSQERNSRMNKSRYSSFVFSLRIDFTSAVTAIGIQKIKHSIPVKNQKQISENTPPFPSCFLCICRDRIRFSPRSRTRPKDRGNGQDTKIRCVRLVQCRCERHRRRRRGIKIPARGGKILRSPAEVRLSLAPSLRTFENLLLHRPLLFFRSEIDFFNRFQRFFQKSVHIEFRLFRLNIIERGTNGGMPG